MDSKDILVSVDHKIFQPFCDDDIIEIRVAVSLSREQWREAYQDWSKGTPGRTVTDAVGSAIGRRLVDLYDEGELGGEYYFADDSLPDEDGVSF